MAATIWKFPLPVGDEVGVVMPAGGRVLTVAAQGDVMVLWAIVDPGAPFVERAFEVRGTGHPLGEVGEYVGTALLVSGLVFHVFEASA